jgi:SMP-30/Gluconolactonase/LRE-like region
MPRVKSLKITGLPTIAPSTLLSQPRALAQRSLARRPLAWLPLVAMSLLAACSESTPPSAAVPTESVAVAASQPAPAVEPAIAAPTACIDEAAISYLCGVINGEDILPLGNSAYLLASGMNGQLSNNAAINGKLHLVNPAARTFSILFPGEAPVLEQNVELYPGCPGPLDVSNFSAHGLALKAVETGTEHYRLYMTSHGAREAIEIFDIDASAAPTIKWIGCVPMPVTSWTNSLVILNDWGFLATQFMDPTGAGMAGVTNKEITGHVFEWHPGAEVSVIAGTELSGPNGIVLTDDERFMYVAAFGTHEIVRFDRSSTPPAKELLPIGIAPDNIRWSTDGTLYTAGGNVTDTCGGPECGIGWSVWEINPSAMTASRLTGVDETVTMQGVSSGVLVGNEIWIGTYGGDRLGILPKP